jgi:hypothetical protein
MKALAGSTTTQPKPLTCYRERPIHNTCELTLLCARKPVNLKRLSLILRDRPNSAYYRVQILRTLTRFACRSRIGVANSPSHQQSGQSRVTCQAEEWPIVPKATFRHPVLPRPQTANKPPVAKNRQPLNFPSDDLFPKPTLDETVHHQSATPPPLNQHRHRKYLQHLAILIDSCVADLRQASLRF